MHLVIISPVHGGEEILVFAGVEVVVVGGVTLEVLAQTFHERGAEEAGGLRMVLLAGAGAEEVKLVAVVAVAVLELLETPAVRVIPVRQPTPLQ
jgi:hypothetical protein